MSLIDDLAPYRQNEWGVVGLYPRFGRSCDNTHLFHAETIVLASRLGVRIPGLELSAMTFTLACMDRPGLIRRWPGDLGATSYDEYIGALVSSWYAQSQGVGFEVHAYGEHTDWMFNSEDPGQWDIRFYFGRYLMLIPLVRRVARMNVSPLQQSAWCAGLLASLIGKKGETSGRILCDVQLDVMRDVSWITKFAVSAWEWVMSKRYAGRAELYGIYFPAEHPLAKHQMNSFRGTA